MKVQLFIRKLTLYVRFTGELDSNVANNMRVKISELIDNYNIKYLVLNCEKLTFMDSSGIGFIIGRFNQIKSKGGIVFLTNLNELIQRIVRLSGVYKIVNIKQDEEDVDRYLEGYYGKIHESAI